MDQDSAHMVVTSKVPILKSGEFDLWRMRIKQYIQMIDYALWEVIENGNITPKTTVVKGVEKVIPPTTAKEKAKKRLEVKAKSTLMMGIPNEHQLKFHSIKDVKLLIEAVEKRIGGNTATKKTQRNLLKQQYENFTAPSSKMFDQTFDRLQKIWNTHAVVWRNKAELETISMDDLYNNLKVYEPEVKGMSSSSSSTQNMDFVSSSNNNSGNSNEVVNTAYGVSTTSTQVNIANSSNVDNLNDIKEMDLRWQMAMLTIRARRFLKNTRRRLTVNSNDNIGFGKESTRRNIPMETSTSTTLVSCDGLGGYNWSDQAEEGSNYALMAYSSSSYDSERAQEKARIAQKEKDSIQFNVDKFENASKSLDKLIECQIVDNCKKGLGYNAVPPPYTVNFMPPTPDLSFTGLDEFVNKPVVENRNSDEEVSKVVRKFNDSLIIEDWVLDSEEENVSQTKTEKKIVKPSITQIEFVKPKQQEKTARKTVKQVEKHRQNTHSPRGNQRNWNNMMSQRLGSNFEMFNKACYVCGSFDHLQVDCNYHQKQFQNQRMVKPVWNNAQRVNHQNFAKKTHPCAKKNMVPRAVLMKSGLVSINTARQNISKTAVSVNTARQVNTAHSKTTVNAARPMSYLSKTTHSTVKRPIHKNTTFKNSNINQRVNTVRGKNVNTARPKAVVNAVKGNNVNVVKASACWVWKPKTKVLDHGNPQMDLQDKGVIDSGCSRHMTGNMSYLTDYEEIDGGYVAFGGNPKGGKNHRKFPRKNNMYSVDLKNIVPKRGLTCLFAKATSDESKLWHRRLGHLNFKTMNKLVKGNLVRGLPSKVFENDQTCVACQKGKQHIASCKSKTKNSISLPLHLLHMDLFGPTFVKSLMKKMYCLVVTDDFENLVDHKVKVIRYDNGTEFKNKEMNQFCEMKGILRQFSVARTPQQNGVAERRNMTLIEAARTMLADSKLPTTFWAEAVNTACYVQNRVLVVKPHNKTPYELFHGRTPTLSFMRPFGCPVTILNTIDHLGKFDGKANKGFFVGYSLNSKAFRVFNSRTRIVEENLHIRFSENTPNVVGDNADLKSSQDDGSKPLSDDEKKVDKDPRIDSKSINQEKDDNVNSTNNVNVVSTNKVNVVGGKTSIELPNNPNMPALEDISIFDLLRDNEDVGKTQKGNSCIEGSKLDRGYARRASTIQVTRSLDFGFEDPDFPDRVYKVEKALYGLHQAPRAWYETLSTYLLDNEFQRKLTKPYSSKRTKNDGIFISQDKYVGEILKKLRFIEVKTASTPIETQKPLLKDKDGEEVDVHMYRLMIGSLMYLTSSRLDIMFAVCACARYQGNPKVLYLHVVKRIFRYLKAQPKLGLWYPKDSPFDLVAYTDSDYAGASLDRKSITGGYEFLGSRLISWQCKKQTVVANSTTKAEYAAASSCYGQVLWIQN
ncbi:putative ribonuclease H-like domain-containing protein [Tanacetum coccineum]